MGAHLRIAGCCLIICCSVREAPLGRPVPPHGVTAGLEAQSARVSWSPDLADGYRVRRLPDGTELEIGPVTEARLALPRAGIGYRFLVFAKRGALLSEPSALSNEVSWTAPQPQPPVPRPEQLAIRAGDSKLDIEWVQPGPAVDELIIITEPATVTSTIAGDARAATLSGLRNGKRYRIGITARSGTQTSARAWSEYAVPNGLPGAPSRITAVAQPGGSAVAWVPPIDDGGAAVEAYEVWIEGTTTRLATMGLHTDVIGLQNGVAVRFTVRARNRNGFGPMSEPSEPVTPRDVPDAPTGVTATAVDYVTARVTWTAPAATGGLPVQAYIVQAESSGAIEFTSGATIAVMGRLPSHLPQRFFVWAMTSAGWSGASAPSAALLLATVPTAPVGVEAMPAKDSAYVTWMPSGNSGGVPVTEYIVTAAGAPPVRVPATQLGVRVPGLTAGGTYAFTVQAVNAIGTGLGAASASVRLGCVRGFPEGPAAAASMSPAFDSWIPTADLNGDGTTDAFMATNGSAEDGLLIVLTSDQGSIARRQFVPLPDGLSSGPVKAAELNGDGVMDFIIVNSSWGREPTFVLSTPGSTSYSYATDLPTRSGVLSVDPGDLDADGDTDIAVLTGSGIELWVQAGGGFSKSPVATVAASSIFLADLDGDRRDEIVYTTHGGTLAVIEDGLGTRQTTVLHSLANQVQVADLDGDGDSEVIAVVFTSTTQDIGIWNGMTRTGTLAGHQTLHAARDVNGDGRTDLVVGGSRPLQLLINAGGGTFTSLPAPGPETGQVAFVDLDRDGLTDRFLLFYGPNQLNLGVSLGRFASLYPEVLPSWEAAVKTLQRDFDRDGILDFVEVGGATSPAILFGGDGGFFRRAQFPAAPGHPSAAGDFDGDGWVDFAVVRCEATGCSTDVYRNDGGAFAVERTLDAYGRLAADFDGDGKDDLLAPPVIYPGNASGLGTTGTWAANEPWLTVYWLDRPLVANVDGVGPDEVFSWNAMWRLDGGSLVSLPGHIDGLPIGAGDLDHDGKLDVVTIRGWEALACLHRPGLTFQCSSVLNKGYPQVDGALADLNGDGNLDIVLTPGTCNGSEVTVTWGRPGGLFGADVPYRGLYNPIFYEAADLNQDGMPDLISGHGGGVVYVHTNVCIE